MVANPACSLDTESSDFAKLDGAARGYDLTFAVSVGTSEDGAFLNAPERLEKAPHIIF